MILSLQQMALDNVIVSQAALDAAVVNETAIVFRSKDAAIVTEAALAAAVTSLDAKIVSDAGHGRSNCLSCGTGCSTGLSDSHCLPSPRCNRRHPGGPGCNIGLLC